MHSAVRRRELYGGRPRAFFSSRSGEADGSVSQWALRTWSLAPSTDDSAIDDAITNSKSNNDVTFGRFFGKIIGINSLQNQFTTGNKK